MFTVKIVNNNEDSTYLKSWSEVNVWRKGSSFFEQQKDKMNDDQDFEFKDDNESLIAVVVNIKDDEYYWVTEWECVYITDSSGKTVEIIRV